MVDAGGRKNSRGRARTALNTEPSPSGCGSPRRTFASATRKALLSGNAKGAAAARTALICEFRQCEGRRRGRHRGDLPLCAPAIRRDDDRRSLRFRPALGSTPGAFFLVIAGSRPVRRRLPEVAADRKPFPSAAVASPTRLSERAATQDRPTRRRASGLPTGLGARLAHSCPPVARQCVSGVGSCPTSRRGQDAPAGFPAGSAANCAASFLVLRFFKYVYGQFRRRRPHSASKQTDPAPRAQFWQPSPSVVDRRPRAANDVARMSRRRGCVARDDRSSGPRPGSRRLRRQSPSHGGGREAANRYASWSGPA